MDVENRLATLEARIAISELRSKYCWYTVRALKDELVGLFVEEGVFQNWRSNKEEPVTVSGRSSLREYFSRMRPARRIPLVVNEVISIDGDSAEGTCAMLSVGDEPFSGHYIDTFKRVEGKWLFSMRRFYPYWPTYRPDMERGHP